MLEEEFESIIRTVISDDVSGETIGLSREGREIFGYHFGHGSLRVSLLGGAHADEPVGPNFLRHFVSFLSKESPESKFLKDYEWLIVPHLNPDGEERNSIWWEKCGKGVELIPYLENVIRELPGDDIEFGFPRNDEDIEARPENRSLS